MLCDVESSVMVYNSRHNADNINENSIVDYSDDVNNDSDENI